MALSLNPGSRGLLLDPFNGVADIEDKVLRVLHNYAFLEDPIRLIRATRLSARFHWPLEERTQARYDAAKENNYIEFVGKRAIGAELEQLAHEDDPINIMRALEKEGWLKVLHPHWSVAKAEASDLGHAIKLRQTLSDLGYVVESGPIAMYFLTRKMSDKDVSEIQRMIPRRDFVDKWKHLEHDAQDLAKKLYGQRGKHQFGIVEDPERCPAGEDPVPQPDHPSVCRRPEDQEFSHQVAPGSREAAVPGDGGVAHYLPASRISQDSRRSVLDVARRQAQVAYRDHEFPEAV